MNLLNLLVSFSNFLIASLGFSIWIIMSFVNKDNWISFFPIYICLFLFFPNLQHWLGLLVLALFGFLSLYYTLKTLQPVSWGNCRYSSFVCNHSSTLLDVYWIKVFICHISSDFLVIYGRMAILITVNISKSGWKFHLRNILNNYFYTLQDLYFY